MTSPLKENNRAAASLGVSPAELFWQMSTDGVAVQLPDSRLTVRLRPVSLAGLVRRGLLPNELYTEAIKGFPELNKATEDASAEDLEKVAAMMIATDTFMFTVLSLALVEPTLVLEPARERGEIGLDMLSEVDKYHILSLVQTPVREWTTFLPKQDASVPAMADGDIVLHQAE